MALDTTTATTVETPRDRVAAFLRDPANDQRWIGGIRAVRLLTPPPVAVGSQVERVAAFLGRRIEYVLEVTELSAERLATRSVKAPFPMRVTYGFRAAGDRSCEVSVRVQGETGRFYGFAGPLLASAVRRSLRRDLRALKQLMERG
jgi:hypothetical protein